MVMHVLDHVIGMDTLATTGFMTECLAQEFRMLTCTTADEMDRRVVRPDIGQF